MSTAFGRCKRNWVSIPYGVVPEIMLLTKLLAASFLAKWLGKLGLLRRIFRVFRAGFVVLNYKPGNPFCPPYYRLIILIAHLCKVLSFAVYLKITGEYK